MPSLGDVANQAKALLEDIKANTNATKNNTATIITELGQLDTDVQNGFANVAQGIAVLVQLQQQNNDLLASNNMQNETIICWLDKIAHVLCDIKRNTDTEVKLQTEMTSLLTHMDDILELVHAREAMDILNRNELKMQIEECCRKEEPPPKPCFDECESPRLPEYRPIKQDWKPIGTTKHKEPR